MEACEGKVTEAATMEPKKSAGKVVNETGKLTWLDDVMLSIHHRKLI